AESLKIEHTSILKYFSVDAAGNVESNYNPQSGKGYNQSVITIADNDKAAGIKDLELLVDRLKNEGDIENSAIRPLK
ncbi:hypothetical protein NXH56_09150, partial [Bifidobacterium thermophilum]|nr:hypothetical protein [Bifidobacterium thermophilum]